MKIKRQKELMKRKFKTNAPSDYIELYLNSNLRGKGLSLEQSIPFLFALKHDEYELVQLKDGHQKVDKMNPRQKKKFWDSRKVPPTMFI